MNSIATSALLETIAEQALANSQSDRITLGEFIDKLAERGFGLIILLCAIPNLFPVNIPGVSTVFSVVIAAITMQWMVGMKRPWLPEMLRKRSFNEKQFATGILSITPKMRRMEQVIRPRGEWMMHHGGIVVAGFCILIQCGILVLPLPMIPFSNAIPAFFIAIIALGILARDGYVMLVAMISGTIAIYFLAVALMVVLGQMWQWVQTVL